MGTKLEGLYLSQLKRHQNCSLIPISAEIGDMKNVQVERTIAKSITGYIVRYVGCPSTWASKMQKEVQLMALSDG